MDNRLQGYKKLSFWFRAAKFTDFKGDIFSLFFWSLRKPVASAPTTQLKLVVSNLEAQITEINSVLKSQALENALEDKFQQLQDKMTQLDKSSKVSY